MKDIPAYILLGIYVIFLFINPEPTILWPIFFLLGLIYAVWVLNYWKKHHDGFNIYVSLILLVMSVTLFGFTLFEYVLDRVFSI